MAGGFFPSTWLSVPASNIASTDLPFPVMSTVNFGDLSVNTSTPRLGLANGETLTTSNAMYFVPTTVHADGFKLMAAVGAARRYLVDAARIDEAGASFQVQVAAWRGKSYVRKLLATADLEVAFRRFGSSVTVQRWPSRARSSMALLATASRRAARALVTWGASGFSLKDAAWAEFRYDEDLLDSCATAARATLGLPPG